MFPLAFVASTTLYAGWRSIFDNFLPLADKPDKAMTGYLDATLTAMLMVCVFVIIAASARAWLRALRGEPVSFVPAMGPDHHHIPGSGCC
jgi:carbon starvation protein CstA